MLKVLWISALSGVNEQITITHDKKKGNKMATKNLGQVAGLWIGTSAPSNTNLIWFDSTPVIRAHKVYSATLESWIVLDQNTISAITYSELRNLARTTGLTQGSWYKITDKSNALALAVTTTKIQYNDNNNNLIIDDLAASSTYVVNSNNLLIDDTQGVWDASTNKLKFTFNDISDVTTNIPNTLMLYGRQASAFIKVKVSRLISSAVGNSIIWNNGFFFNFLSNLRGQYDVEGGVTSKTKHDTDKAALQQNIDNVAASNQNILTSAKNYADGEVVNTKIYGKTIPAAPAGGTPTDIIAGDTLATIINKIHRWINKFKYATGISISPNFCTATSYAPINNNDTVESALGKIQQWFQNIELSLSPTWAPIPRTQDIVDIQAGDTFQNAFAKIQGKFDQIGLITKGKIQSPSMVPGLTTDYKTTLDLDGASLTMYGASTTNKVQILGSSGLYAYNSGDNVAQVTGDGIFGNYPGQYVYPVETGIYARATIVGLGYANQSKDVGEVTDDTNVKRFIAGVAGVASNSSGHPCDTWGGYFVRAKIMGLYVRAIRVLNSFSIGKDDDVIACYNSGEIFVSLPSNPSCGKEIKIIQVNSADVIVTCPDGAKILYAGNIGGVLSLAVGGSEHVMFLFWDGQFWHATRTSA